jgi:hypothetical protein
VMRPSDAIATATASSSATAFGARAMAVTDRSPHQPGAATQELMTAPGELAPAAPHGTRVTVQNHPGRLLGDELPSQRSASKATRIEPTCSGTTASDGSGRGPPVRSPRP